MQLGIPVEVTPHQIGMERSLGAAIELCAKAAGLEPKQVQAVPALEERLAGVVIEQRDALATMAHHDAPETLFYLDPPYVHSTRSGKVRGTTTSVGGRGSGKAYRHEMDDEAHRAFALVARSVEGMVVLSGYPCALYDGLFGDWERFARPAFADGARERTEVVWLNPACSAALERSRGGLFAEHAA